MSVLREILTKGRRATRGVDCIPPTLLWRRLALVAARGDASAEVMERALGVIAKDEAAFVAFLLQNGLGPVWRHALRRNAIDDRVSAASREKLDWSRRSAATNYMIQEAALRQIDRLFEEKGIAYALIKGAHIRELVYPEPSLRPSCDIDILVSAKQRAAAAKALIGQGFQYYRAPETISHEAIFIKGVVNVDLHWNILRPGRMRMDLTDRFIDRRCRYGWFWGLSDSDAVFVMLAHPAFTKYISSPNMELCRVVDFIRWTERRVVDWDGVAELFEEAGLKTAAWSLLFWFAALGVAAPDRFVAKIKPGEARVAYLRYWLENDLPTRFLERRPLLIQLGLTLFLHDRVSDARRAMYGWFGAYLDRPRSERALMRM